MADYRVVDIEKLETDLTGMADEVRVLAGTTEKMSMNKMTESVAQANESVEVQTDIISQIKTVLRGKVAGEKEEQEKTLDIVENGSYDILPDEGKVLSSASVNVNIPPKEEQEKILEVTKNGSYEVLPDEDKILSGVNVEVNVAFEGDIEKPYIDTSKITDFSYFCRNDRLNNYDKIDTSNGKNFERFCENCKKMLEIPNFDTRNGTTFYYAFSGCENLVSGKVDISNATSLNYMFEYCAKLETIELTIPKSDLGTRTFYSTSTLKHVIIPNGWNVSIYLNYSYALTSESLHGIIENLADLTGKTAKTFQVGATNLAKIDEAHIAMLQNKNWNYS